MNDTEKIIDKLRKLEAIFAGTTYEGERTAAGIAMGKLRERLRNFEQVDPPITFKFTLPDMWSRKLFVALLRRYGVTPYRRPRQKHTTVMAELSKRFVDETLWPEYLQLSTVLDDYLEEVTDRIISESVFTDTSEAETREEPARLSAR